MTTISRDTNASQQARRDSRWADLERLRSSHPMMDAIIEEVSGRRIRVGNHWLSDFASCNYLGFDLHPQIIAAVAPAVAKWGTHPSWSRLLGNPRPYVEIEDRLTELLAAPDTLVLPTITLIHTSVIPVLVGQGAVLVDSQAHKTIYEGAAIARGAGATLVRVRANDPGHLEESLRSLPARMSKVFCIDGVNSMTGNAPDLPVYARICREYDTVLYVDDAHGFGIIGERPGAEQPWGHRGNSIVRFYGETYDNIVLVAGLSKAYSSLAAFLALPTSIKNYLKVAAPPYLYSGPSPTASLATVLAGLDVNEAEGDAIRRSLRLKTQRVLAQIADLGLRTQNTSGLPVIELPLGHADEIDAVGRFLFERGIYVTLAPYPLVPRTQVGFRIQVTASNDDDQIEHLNAVLVELAARFDMQRAVAPV
ncbi:MAG TPA: aminotransferase class I/II-fold pyridoxal phosphate-dependent enzyme [Acidimicrobiales bacterium]|nr:aminotransferase class I/II-fold pyridoxal phosphate-dependent enzyme [Acidimicrobiales bacterium]